MPIINNDTLSINLSTREPFYSLHSNLYNYISHTYEIKNDHAVLFV